MDGVAAEADREDLVAILADPGGPVLVRERTDRLRTALTGCDPRRPRRAGAGRIVIAEAVA